MKVRVLWVPPAERDLKCGEVYDLADAELLISRGEAEPVAAAIAAAKDPRSAPVQVADAKPTRARAPRK